MNTIDRLRILLDSFYEGRASEKEISEIREIFASESDLPDDLMSDKDVIDAMSDPRLDDIPVPQDVEELFEKTIKRLDVPPLKKKSTVLLWVKVSGIAAAVALMLATGIHLMHRDELGTDENRLLVAAVSPASVQKKVPQEEKVESETPISVVDASEKTAKKNTTPRVGVVPVSDVKVVTDPGEAEEYMLMAVNLLSENMNKAEKMAGETADAIDKMNQTLNNILK